MDQNEHRSITGLEPLPKKPRLNSDSKNGPPANPSHGEADSALCEKSAAEAVNCNSTARSPAPSSQPPPPNTSFSGIPGLFLIGGSPDFTPIDGSVFQDEKIAEPGNPPKEGSKDDSEITQNIMAINQPEVIAQKPVAEPALKEEDCEMAQIAIEIGADSTDPASIKIETLETDAPEIQKAVASENPEPHQPAPQSVNAAVVEDHSADIGLENTETAAEEIRETTKDNEELSGSNPPEEDLPPVASPTQNDLAQASENKSTANPEWQFDSSDAEEGSGDSDNDDASSSNSTAKDEEDSDSDGDYPMLSTEQIAKLLMTEASMDDDGEGLKGEGSAVRTRNELVQEPAVEKPSVLVTAEMEISELGTVESIVGTMLLVKGSVSGDYQVLNEGSLLVREDRKIVGTVADTLGRVEEPRYMVRFNNPEEIKDAGLEMGTKIFYVADHSTYVFTQALKAVKGSDASNIHDEEIGEADQEFSDDEAEAEHKQKQKQKRRGRGGRDRGGGGGDEGWNTQTPVTNKDELYEPLVRPANLHEMLSQPPPPLPLPPLSNRGGRGGRGGGRGGDRWNNHSGRGGGRGGGGGGGGGGRGGRGRGGSYKSTANSPSASPPLPASSPIQSFHPRYNSQPPLQINTLPEFQRPAVPQYHTQNQTQYNSTPAPQQQFPQSQYFAPYPQFYPPQQHQQQQQDYANYQYHQPHSQAHQQQQPFHSQPQSPTIPKDLPSGAHVNPAFLRSQQQQQQQQAPSDPRWTDGGNNSTGSTGSSSTDCLPAPPPPQMHDQRVQDVQRMLEVLKSWKK